MAKKKVYDNKFKIQAVKLGREIGFRKSAKELGVNIDTLYGWNKRAKDARLDLGPGTQMPETAMSLTEEVPKLRQQTREQANVSAIFGCYDLGILGLAIADSMKAGLCVATVKNAYQAFPSLRGAIIHSDRGSQRTSAFYRAELGRCGIA